MLENSIINNWTDVYEPKPTLNTSSEAFKHRKGTDKTEIIVNKPILLTEDDKNRAREMLNNAREMFKNKAKSLNDD